MIDHYEFRNRTKELLNEVPLSIQKKAILELISILPKDLKNDIITTLDEKFTAHLQRESYVSGWNDAVERIQIDIPDLLLE